MYFGIKYTYYVNCIIHRKINSFEKNEKNELEIQDNLVPSNYDGEAQSVSFISNCYVHTLKKIESKNDVNIIETNIRQDTQSQRIAITNFILLTKKIFMFKAFKQMNKMVDQNVDMTT